MTLALEKIGMRVGASMYLEDIELSLPASSVTTGRRQDAYWWMAAM